MNSELIAAAVGGAATFLIAWGMMRAKTSELERRVQKIETTCEGLHDSYVSYTHFNDFVAGIKDNYRDLKNDIQRLFEAVSKSVGKE